ncbi:DUF2130 domain-containing protein [Spiroplasma monobiae]|uniref:DUF2130 domain-containing protein n=1 Tax=Spiroplasma monobiae MQ-1 TaxID=1336748 RepID=A0A2K9LUN7_SPISQ|nr:DUF2130 domain-containing protein [Spiroplasma monobiae]AUM62762.1 hypothetical protein SMONO_v1c05130 [Spiroplasma monobiae MQ-1]
MEKLIINCPECKKDIDLLMLGNRDTESVIKYKEHLKKEIEKGIEQKLTSNLKKEFELRMDSEKKQIELNKQSEISELNNIIVKLKSDIANSDLINNQKLESLKNQLESNNKLLLNKLELELKSKYESVISTKEAEITDLKVANATNRILNNKTKGENWENEVELELRKLASATGDEVSKITRTGTKADFLQIVKEKEKELGKIVFECKNGDWKDTWEPKLTEDMAKEGANYAILVATSTSEKFKVPFLVSNKNKNILIANPESFVFVCSMIRKLIIIELGIRYKSEKNDISDKFNNWKLNSLENFKGIIQKSVELIESDERTIINKVENIKKNREKLWRNWQKIMLDFLEGFNF